MYLRTVLQGRVCLACCLLTTHCTSLVCSKGKSGLEPCEYTKPYSVYYSWLSRICKLEFTLQKIWICIGVSSMSIHVVLRQSVLSSYSMRTATKSRGPTLFLGPSAAVSAAMSVLRLNNLLAIKLI